MSLKSLLVMGLLVSGAGSMVLYANDPPPRVQRVLERYQEQAQQVDKTLEERREAARKALHEAEETARKEHLQARRDAVNTLQRLVSPRLSQEVQDFIHRQIVLLDPFNKESREYLQKRELLDEVLAEVASMETDLLGQPIGAAAVAGSGLAGAMVVQPAPGGHFAFAASAEGVSISRQGATFDGSGYLAARNQAAVTQLIRQIQQQGTFSVAIWVSSSSMRQRGPARMLGLSRDTQVRNLTIGQENHQLVVRIRTSTTDPNGIQGHLSAPRTIQEDVPMLVVATRDQEGVHRLYINGELKDEQNVGGDLSNWDDSMSLIMGAEANGERTWAGTVHGVQIFLRPLSSAEVAGLAP